MSATRGPGFVGRTGERDLLDGLLTTVRRGESQTLVIRGEPGVGKTALLRYVARQASGFRIAQIAVVQAEMELPFAAIHQLCAPMLDRLDALPPPQQNALEVAFGLSPGKAPDRFLVAVAALSLLGAVAEERPLLCLVDDAHWLDATSGQVLGFVARRLLAERLGVVFGIREPIEGHALHGLPELRLKGLEDADARALLASAVPGRLDDRIRDRVVAETRGNPLALLELAQGMDSAERAGGFVLPAGGDLPNHLEARYAERIGTLPEPTQRLILLAAADPLGEATLLWRAAERLSIEPGALSPAVEAGLLEIADRVRFHHPLVRSAVYRSASPDERRRVHGALAEVSDPQLDGDRRAWHHALAAAGPDEAVAAELERSAERAQGRGGLAAAAALLERATVLTVDPALQARRALAAAEAGFQAGEFPAVLRLLAIATSCALDGFQSAQADLLQAHVTYASRYGDDAAPLFLQAAKRLEPFDLDLARKAYLTAWSATVAAGRFGGGAGVLLEICHAIRALPPATGTSHALDLLLDGLAALATDGRAAATPILQRAAKAVAEMPAEDVVRWGRLAGTAASAIWDSDASSATFERQAQIVRDAGALAELPIHLGALAVDKAWRGDFAGAGALVAESDSVAAATGTRVPPFAALRLRALQGSEAAASALIDATIEQAEATGQGEMAKMGLWGASVLYNGLARYEEALSAACEVIAGAIDPWTSMWVLPELVEAAARVGAPELARDALNRLTETSQPARTDFALGIEARSRALLADGAAAEDLYREAIERLSRTQLRPELARAHLVFGEWLRRAGRVIDAREQLRAAEDMFAEIGMEAFAGRARGELAAAGAKTHRRLVERREELTPQEQQIARLACGGLTNSEIGSQLFLSPRTVEWHLHKVFAKLEIESRSGLQGALLP